MTSIHSGLGLLEYLTFFEDAGMEPIMAVWSGMLITPYNVDLTDGHGFQGTHWAGQAYPKVRLRRTSSRQLTK